MLRYYLFHKPYEVMSQFSEAGEKKTLAHFCTGLPKDVYPIGRLDYDSEGLLILSNDKSLTHRLLDPRYRHPRTYWSQVEGSITQDALAQLQSGILIRIDGKAHHTIPAKAKRLEPAPVVALRQPPIRVRQHIPTSWLALTLTEGKNRQVRRMTAAVGFPTLRLIRYSIGSVTIDGLEAGECREADAHIVQRLLR